MKDSVKARNIERDSRVSICVDDQTPQFSFVIINGTAKYFTINRKNFLSGLLK